MIIQYILSLRTGFDSNRSPERAILAVARESIFQSITRRIDVIEKCQGGIVEIINRHLSARFDE